MSTRSEWERIAGLIGSVAGEMLAIEGRGPKDFEGVEVTPPDSEYAGKTCATFDDSYPMEPCSLSVDIDDKTWEFIEREASGDQAWRNEYRAETEDGKAAPAAAGITRAARLSSRWPH